jgi:hypothetical protein
MDNAPMEYLIGHLKDEIDFKLCKSVDELKIMIYEYMEEYNNFRYQWGIKENAPGSTPRSSIGSIDSFY